MASRNLILNSLSSEDFEVLRPHLDPLPLPFEMCLQAIGEPIDHCYFPERGMISVVIRLQDGSLAEAGVIGREGVTGLPALTGGPVAAPFESMVQIDGEGARIGTGALREAMFAHPSILDRVMRYSQALAQQVMQSAVCNARHPVSRRLARWLLMAHDRADGDVLPLTQDLLSMMLGVRRPSVSIVAHLLERTGAIRYQRGKIEIVNRAALEASACECYAAVQDHVRALFGRTAP